jgi:uncharacterized protein YndB with AHSA1/START domain
MSSVTTVVGVDQMTAFRIFTEQTDAWWKRTLRHLHHPQTAATIRFEEGRLLEQHEHEAYELGVVSVWEPPERLVLSWLSDRPSAGDRTEVEVRFEPLGERTRVTVEHRGWTGLRPGDARSSVIGLWWSDLLVNYAARAR